MVFKLISFVFFFACTHNFFELGSDNTEITLLSGMSRSWRPWVWWWPAKCWPGLEHCVKVVSSLQCVKSPCLQGQTCWLSSQPVKPNCVDPCLVEIACYTSSKLSQPLLTLPPRNKVCTGLLCLQRRPGQMDWCEELSGPSKDSGTGSGHLETS